MKKRIGPRMRDVSAFVAANPGEYMARAAEHVAPYGRGIGFGYQSVWRAIAAGLIRYEPVKTPRKGYRLYPVDP